MKSPTMQNHNFSSFPNGAAPTPLVKTTNKAHGKHQMMPLAQKL
jgi:hypothetical protein